MRRRLWPGRCSDDGIREAPGHEKYNVVASFLHRFAIGVLAATVTLPVHPILAGAIVGLLISLPDAFGLKSYVGVLGTGLVFGGLTGWAAKMWGT